MAENRGKAADPVPRPAMRSRHALRDQDALWEEVLKMASSVAVSLSMSVQALREGRTDLAAAVKSQEPAIDRWEVRIEQECLRVLALFDPLGTDFRRVVAALKINGDLERMADLAEHVADRVKKLAKTPGAFPIPQPLADLAQEALSQVSGSLDALARGDADLARAVIEGDRKVNRHRRAVLKELKRAVQQDPEQINTWLRLINTARNLERVADHATNIAEAIVYIKFGHIIRHVVSGPTSE